MNTIAQDSSKLISLKDFRLNTEAVTAEVAKGQSFLVLKRSKPIFQINPVEREWTMDFREINPHGVAIDEVMKAVQKELSK